MTTVHNITHIMQIWVTLVTGNSVQSVKAPERIYLWVSMHFPQKCIQLFCTITKPKGARLVVNRN